MSSIFSLIASTFTIKILLLILGGTCFGMLIGAIPGLNTTLAVAIIIPATFALEPVEAMALLMAVYKAGTYGGSISAVLLGVPGTPASACTVKDGYALAKKGKANIALETALYATTFADIVSNISLILVASWLAKFALKFGPAENALLVVFALVVVSLVASPNLIKGLLAACIGLSIAVIGMDPITAKSRFTFGSINMLSGISLIPTLVGLFAISELYMEYDKFLKGSEHHAAEKLPQTKEHLSAKQFFSYWWTLLRSSLVGVFIGALPGSGAATASYISYSLAQTSSKEADQFGKGSVEAICAAEAGNNGVCGATMIPLLTLGIPGDSITAIMYGALVLQGITPGPLVFTQQADLVNSIFILLFVCSLFMFVVGKISVSGLAKVLNVPQGILFPLITVICFAGTYAMNNSMFDVLVMVIAGVVGYFLKCFEMPVAPILIGFILGTSMEKSILQAMVKSHNSFSIFFGSPIAIAFDLLIIGMIVFHIISLFRKKAAAAK